MKFFNTLPVSVLVLLAACGGAAVNQSTVKDDQGTTNDLPNVYLSCNETVDGADVLDGAKELTIFKDQFGIYSAKVVQKDQFSGDYVLASFLSLTRTTQTNGIDVREPIEAFAANEAGSTLNFGVYQRGGALTGKLELKTPQIPNGVTVQFRCGNASTTEDSPLTDAGTASVSSQQHTLTLCQTPSENGVRSQHAMFYLDGSGSGMVIFDVEGRNHGETDVNRVKVFECVNNVCMYSLDPTGYTRARLNDDLTAFFMNGRNWQYDSVPCSVIQ